MTVDPHQVALKVLQGKEENKHALKVLLDEQLGQDNVMLVSRARMGHTTSYVGSVSLQWFANNVRFASNLPLFQHKLDTATKKIIIDQDTINEISQRNPDWSRQAAMTQYLI